MKKKSILFFILFFVFLTNINALTISKDDVNPRTYIIGKYMFTRNSNENYDGILTTRRIMLASRTIIGNTEEEMILYYKKADGMWIDALNGENINAPDNFEIEVTDIDSSLNVSVDKFKTIDYSNNDINPLTYVIGKYMFTRTPNNEIGYDGILTTKKIMLASRTISGSTEAEMTIYYKRPSGDWVNALTNEPLVFPSVVGINNIDLVPLIKDTTKPTCSFGDIQTIDVGKTGTITLTCTDEETGISSKPLTANAFEFDDSKIEISTITSSKVTNGRKYSITLIPIVNGTINITLNAGAIEDNSSNSNDELLTAVYGRKTLTMSFDANGGEGVVEPLTCQIINESSCKVVLPTNSFTYNDWVFNGWGESALDTAGLSANANVQISNDVTRYAIWKKELAVTFKANGCATSDKTLDNILVYNGNINVTVDVPMPTMKSGWEYLGANTEARATTGLGTINISNENELYFICRKEISRTLSYSANGGSGSMEASTCTFEGYNGNTTGSCNIELKPNEFVYNGWTFEAWGDNNLATSGSESGSTISLATDITRYAIWKKNVAVVFNANGCTVENGVANKTIYNGATSLDVVVPTVTMNNDWISLGASADADSITSGVRFGYNMPISNIGQNDTSITRYYNCRKKVTRKLTYIANDGSDRTSSSTCDSYAYNGGAAGSCSLSLKQNEFVYSGWNFEGWGTSPNSTMGLSSGTEVTLFEDLNKYAIWRKNLTVTFDANGCTPENKTVNTIIYNGANEANVIVPVVSNGEWTILGASASSSATTPGTPLGSSMAISNIGQNVTSITRYYNCTKQIVRVLSYDGNGGTGSMSSSVCTFTGYNGNTTGSCNIELKPNEFNRPGWKFNGWGEQPNLTFGDAAGVNISLFSDATRYATWKEINYTFKLEMVDNYSPDLIINVYEDGVKIDFNSISYNGYQICTGEVPVISYNELGDANKLDVELTNGDVVVATLSNET